jgi:hypothetical protein
LLVVQNRFVFSPYFLQIISLTYCKWLLSCLGTCHFGSACKESHDAIPHGFCYAYNNFGVCDYSTKCRDKHVLFNYDSEGHDASQDPRQRPIAPKMPSQGTGCNFTGTVLKTIIYISVSKYLI